MVSRSRLYAQLDSLELELEEKLVPHLQEAAKGKNEFVFCAANFIPHLHLRSKADKNTAALISLGESILSLKTKLGDPSEGSIAERLCWYCDAWGNLADRHRNSGQELALQFLDEIKQSSSA